MGQDSLFLEISPIRQPAVLVVDDDPASVRHLTSCLKNNGCKIVLVTSGAEAIDELTTRAYDLVFLDWTMPHVSGGQAIVRLEKLFEDLDPMYDSQYTQLRVPIIIYSGRRAEEIQPPFGPHFNVIDHWQKNIPLGQLNEKVWRAVNTARMKLLL